jgi:hypothetical protein
VDVIWDTNGGEVEGRLRAVSTVGCRRWKRGHLYDVSILVFLFTQSNLSYFWGVNSRECNGKLTLDCVKKEGAILIVKRGEKERFKGRGKNLKIRMPPSAIELSLSQVIDFSL